MTQKTILALVDIAHKEDALNLIRQTVDLFAGQDIHLAYVMPYGFFSYVEPFVSDDSIKAAAERAKAELAALAEEAGAASATRHVLRGGIGDQIILLAKQLEADILHINAVRHDSQHGTLGTHAAQVARHEPCTVVICR
jgi:nucleotide-binding universal stress UspA family protein